MVLAVLGSPDRRDRYLCLSDDGRLYTAANPKTRPYVFIPYGEVTTNEEAERWAEDLISELED
jgi:hypothetical protein